MNLDINAATLSQFEVSAEQQKAIEEVGHMANADLSHAPPPDLTVGVDSGGTGVPDQAPAI